MPGMGSNLMSIWVMVPVLYFGLMVGGCSGRDCSSHGTCSGWGVVMVLPSKAKSAGGLKAAQALLTVLAHGDRDIREGRVRPLEDVVRRLRMKKNEP